MKRVNVSLNLEKVFLIHKQCWNQNKCRCECKEPIDKGECDKGFISIPINCECECDKTRDLGEYLDYKNSNAEKN